MKIEELKIWRAGAFMLLGLALGASNALGETSANETNNPYVWKPKTKSVSVFKNGFGFFTRAGKVALNDGWAHAAEVPPATFGTLAIYSQEITQIVDIVGVGEGETTRFDSVEQPADEATKQKVIESALGTIVTIKYFDGMQELEASGEVKSISGGYVVLKQGTTHQAIPVTQTRSMQRSTCPLRFHVVSEKQADPSRAELNMAYLRSGIVWIPEYTLKIIDEETAELTLRGTLVNEAEDLIDCDVNFVVGVPHFVHTDLMSPIAVGHAIRAIGTAMPNTYVPQQVMSQVMNRAAIANNFYNNGLQSAAEGMGSDGSPVDEGSSFASLMSNLPQNDAVGSGDYSVYTKGNLTVRKGERATVTLMSKKIRYGHKYRWTTDSEIQHHLTLENNSTTPWTTGPCLAISGAQPLSEDVLKYTPVQGKGELTVTTAINISKNIKEAEIDRNLKAHEPSPQSFLDLVRLEGTIKLKSFEKKPIEITISKKLLGKPLTASDDGMITLDSNNLRLTERNGTIEWSMTIEPGKDYFLNYTYERYVPSN
jgi:hypothetical protein